MQFFQSTNRCRAKTKVMEEVSSQNSGLGKLCDDSVTSIDILNVNFVIFLLFIDDFRHFFGNFK